MRSRPTTWCGVAVEGAAEGFAPGIIAPTAVVVAEPGITGRTEQLAELERPIEDLPGVSGVLGPSDQPIPRELGVGGATSNPARTASRKSP